MLDTLFFEGFKVPIMNTAKDFRDETSNPQYGVNR